MVTFSLPEERTYSLLTTTGATKEATERREEETRATVVAEAIPVVPAAPLVGAAASAQAGTSTNEVEVEAEAEVVVEAGEVAVDERPGQEAARQLQRQVTRQCAPFASTSRSAT